MPYENRDDEDPGLGPAIALIALGLATLAGIGGLVWWAWVH